MVLNSDIRPGTKIGRYDLLIETPVTRIFAQRENHIRKGVGRMNSHEM